MKSNSYHKYRMALDRESNRIMDRSGFMHVKNNILTRASVDNYLGHEIPGADELGLDPDKVYRVFRPPEELQKAMASLSGLPILDEHNQDMSSDSPMQELYVGSVGTSPRWSEDAQGIVNEVTFTCGKAIRDINNRRRNDLSCGYNYDAEMAPRGASWNGEPYDLVMRNLEFNHVALVPEGRVKGAMVADAAVKEFGKDNNMKNASRGGMDGWKDEMLKITWPMFEKQVDLKKQLDRLRREIESIEGSLLGGKRLGQEIPKEEIARSKAKSQQLKQQWSAINQQMKDIEKKRLSIEQEHKQRAKAAKMKGTDMATIGKRRVAPGRVRLPLKRRGMDAEIDERLLQSQRVSQERRPEGTDADYDDPREMMAEGAENSIVDAIQDLVDQFRGVHRAEGVENIESVPTEDEEVEIEIEGEDADPATSPALAASPATMDEESFVSAVRDALESHTTGGMVQGEPVIEDNGPSALPAMDADTDLTRVGESDLHGWIQRIEAELRNRDADRPSDTDLVGDEENLALTTEHSAQGNDWDPEGMIAEEKKGKAMDAKKAVDAALRQERAAVNAKNAAIALVEPLVGSVTKLMAMDSAEDILRHTLEAHGEKPPKDIGLPGLHGMVNMLLTAEQRKTMGVDNNPPERKGVDAQVADAVAKARARIRVVA